MISLLARLALPPWLAKLLVGVALALALWGALAWHDHGVLARGVAQERTRRDALDAANTRKALAEQARLNGLIAKAQAELAAALARLDSLRLDLDHEQAASHALQSDLAAGRRRLSVAIARPGHADPAQPADGAAAGRLDTQPAATAELDGTVAANLVGLTGEGDSAIVRLNACIAAYALIEHAINDQDKIKEGASTSGD